MTAFITILLAVVAAALIIYPYFGKESHKPASQKTVPVKTPSRKRTGTARPSSENVDAEIEKRIRGIRDSKTLFCHECGKQIKPGSKFCTYCGAKLN